MHLSLLCDGYPSAGGADVAGLSLERSLGRVHRAGLARGLAVIAALSLPLGLTVALAPAEEAKITLPAPAPATLKVVHLRAS